MSKLVSGVFIGVFVGAFACELIKKTKIAEKAGRKIKDGYKSAKKAFMEGYQSVSGDEPPAEDVPAEDVSEPE